MDNYGRTAVCGERGDKTWFTSVIGPTRSARNCSVTYRRRLEDHSNSLAQSLFQRPNYNRRLKRYYPADIATTFQLVLCKIPRDQNQSIVIEFNQEIYRWMYLLLAINP